MELSNFIQLVQNTKTLPILGNFLKSSSIINNLNKLGEIHLNIAIETLQDLEHYNNERDAFLIVLNHLKTSHAYFYNQRVEHYKNIYNLSLDVAISMGFNIHQYNENQYKEAYIACLLAVVHCYLGNSKSLITDQALNAIYAIKNRHIKPEDSIYFVYDDSPLHLKVKFGVMDVFGSIGGIANFRNWSYIFEDETVTKQKDDSIIDYVFELKNNLIDIVILNELGK